MQATVNHLSSYFNISIAEYEKWRNEHNCCHESGKYSLEFDQWNSRYPGFALVWIVSNQKRCYSWKEVASENLRDSIFTHECGHFLIIPTEVSAQRKVRVLAGSLLFIYFYYSLPALQLWLLLIHREHWTWLNMQMIFLYSWLHAQGTHSFISL